MLEVLISRHNKCGTVIHPISNKAQGHNEGLTSFKFTYKRRNRKNKKMLIQEVS